MKMNKNILNAPVVALGVIASLSSVSTPTLTCHYLNNKKHMLVCNLGDTSTSDYFNRGIVSQKVNLEEDTNTVSPDAFESSIDNKYLGFNQENEKYIIKNRMSDFIDEVDSMFGGMRYLTEEEQEEYNNNLKNIYKETTTQLFDFV